MSSPIVNDDGYIKLDALFESMGIDFDNLSSDDVALLEKILFRDGTFEAYRGSELVLPDDAKVVEKMIRDYVKQYNAYYSDDNGLASDKDVDAYFDGPPANNSVPGATTEAERLEHYGIKDPSAKYRSNLFPTLGEIAEEFKGKTNLSEEEKAYFLSSVFYASANEPIQVNKASSEYIEVLWPTNKDIKDGLYPDVDFNDPHLSTRKDPGYRLKNPDGDLMDAPTQDEIEALFQIDMSGFGRDYGSVLKTNGGFNLDKVLEGFEEAYNLNYNLKGDFDTYILGTNSLEANGKKLNLDSLQDIEPILNGLKDYIEAYNDADSATKNSSEYKDVYKYLILLEKGLRKGSGEVEKDPVYKALEDSEILEERELAKAIYSIVSKETLADRTGLFTARPGLFSSDDGDIVFNDELIAALLQTYVASEVVKEDGKFKVEDKFQLVDTTTASLSDSPVVSVQGKSANKSV